MKITPTEAPLGAVVTEIDLAAPLDGAAISGLEAAMAEHKVLSFPDQALTLEQLEAFTQQMGEFGADPFIEPMPGHPNVLELRREPDETVSNFGAGWHSDWSFQDTPPSYTILHGDVIPPVGGDTLFCDCQAAWDDLPEDVQEMLLQLNGVHSAILPYSLQGVYAQDADKRSMKFRLSAEAEEMRSHPLVRVHPVSGRLSIYASQVYTIGIEDMEFDEASEILNTLHEHLTQPQYIYRHKWAKDTLLMWDNRAVNHFAEGGYDGHLRVMHRTTVKGEVPVAAAPRDS